MLQAILVGLTLTGALFYLGKKWWQQWNSKEQASCESCHCSKK